MKLKDATIDQIAEALRVQGGTVEWIRPTSGSPPTVWIHVIKDRAFRDYGFDPDELLDDVAQQLAMHLLAKAPS